MELTLTAWVICNLFNQIYNYSINLDQTNNYRWIMAQLMMTEITLTYSEIVVWLLNFAQQDPSNRQKRQVVLLYGGYLWKLASFEKCHVVV